MASIYNFRKTISILGIVSILFVSGCKKNKEKNVDESRQARIEQNQEKTEVRVAKARKDRFEMELVSNGKAEAREKATLNFLVADVIDSIFVTNGARVKKGDPILQVDGYNARQQRQDALLNLKKAELELRNRLMSEGINDLKDTLRLPAQRLHTIMLQCGYTSAVSSYEKACRDYANIRTTAPFTGIVSDLEAKPYNPSSAYKNVCTRINDSQMEVVFNVLETEIGYIHRGMDVELTPYANQSVTLHGKVSEVNPRIDENGMVKIKATADNASHILIDGMNVSIILKRQIEDKLIVPKTAVLPRQGKKVVFVHQNGKAIWKYVTTDLENSREISIESGLKEGEEVIYENNLGLSHENEVIVIETKN